MMSADQIGSGFDNWLVISFGVLIAIHATKGAIGKYIKLLICGLYLAGTSNVCHSKLAYPLSQMLSSSRGRYRREALNRNSTTILYLLANKIQEIGRLK